MPHLKTRISTFSLKAVPNETAVDTSVGELAFSSTTLIDTKDYEAQSIVNCDYIHLLGCPKLFGNPEQRRREVENELSEIWGVGNLEEHPVTLPELFKNVTESYQECSQWQLRIYCSLEVNTQMY